MTKAEEKNMWARLVALEEIVAKLEKSVIPGNELPGQNEPITPHVSEPPRDLYGAAVGRPNM